MPSTAIDLAYPLTFLLAAALLLGLIVEACYRIRRAHSIPSLLVYGTIGAWYLGIMITMGPTNFLLAFGTELTDIALWQVMLFLAAYRIAIHYLLSRREVPGVQVSVSARISQATVGQMFAVLCLLWLLLFVVGLNVTGWQVLAVIWPPVAAEKVGMFTRQGIGQGSDFLLSTGAYLYIVVCGSFGMLAVLAKGQTRLLAGSLFVFTLPYFLFDRARSGMLTVLLPAAFSYLVATWGHLLKKLVVCVLLMLLINFWFRQIMHYRGDSGEYKMSAILTSSADDEADSLMGLDMLSELCYMNAFIQNGTFAPNWGQRYFAELANSIPRTIWPGKPLIGFEYAYARGFRNVDSEDEDAVFATISTGMIGQGIANFGRFFGVIAAALLMTGWTAILSKLWQRRYELPRFLLFLLGCGLTFNLGRDITLLVLWPFVFAYGFVRLFEKFQPGGLAARKVPLTPQTRVPHASQLPLAR